MGLSDKYQRAAGCSIMRLAIYGAVLINLSKILKMGLQIQAILQDYTSQRN